MTGQSPGRSHITYWTLRKDQDTSKSQWMVKVNGTTLAPTDYIHKPLAHPYESGMGQPNEYACFKCPRALVRNGLNKIALILENGPPVTVRYFDLVLP